MVIRMSTSMDVPAHLMERLSLYWPKKGPKSKPEQGFGDTQTAACFGFFREY